VRWSNKAWIEGALLDSMICKRQCLASAQEWGGSSGVLLCKNVVEHIIWPKTLPYATLASFSRVRNHVEAYTDSAAAAKWYACWKEEEGGCDGQYLYPACRSAWSFDSLVTDHV